MGLEGTMLRLVVRFLDPFLIFFLDFNDLRIVLEGCVLFCLFRSSFRFAIISSMCVT